MSIAIENNVKLNLRTNCKIVSNIINIIAVRTILLSIIFFHLV